MDENVLPDENPGSPLKLQVSLGKNFSNHKPALSQRSPLKDIANQPSEATIVKEDIKFDAVYRLHEDEGWHEGTEGTDRIAHHNFAYEAEGIRISSDMMTPELAVGNLLHRDVAKFREVIEVSLEDSESEYESAEDLEEIEKPFIQKIVSLTPVINLTLLQATSSSNCTPNRMDDVFENSLLNSFENMKIAETDEPTLRDNFHDADDVRKNITKLFPHSRKMPEENISTETKITEQPTASPKRKSEILPNKNEYSCVASLDKKDILQCSQNVAERAVDIKPLKENTEKKVAMKYNGKESPDELIENLDPDQKCDQMNFLNKLDDTNFDPFTKKTNLVNSPNKTDALLVTKGETSCEMAVTTVFVEVRETLLQEGVVPEKKGNVMEIEDLFLKKKDPVLESKHTVSEKTVTVLVSECNVLEKKDTNLEEEDTCLEIGDTASEKEGPSLEKEFTVLETEETSLEREETSLEREETSLEREDGSLKLEELSHGREDTPLQKENTVFVEKEAEVPFENGGPELMIKDEDTSLHKGLKVNFLNLEDPFFNLGTNKSYVFNSPDKQDSAYSVQSPTEEEIYDSSALILPKSNDITDNSSGKELLEEIRKDSIPQQSEVEPCVNLHNKVDGIHNSESAIKEINDKSLNYGTKNVTSLDNKCLEEQLEDESPLQRVDSPSRLCITFDPITIRAAVNQPGEEDNTVIHVDVPKQKQKTEVTPEKKETSSLSLEKIVTEESEENEEPPQNSYLVNFPSNVYNLDYDTFTTKLSITSSLVKKDNIPNLSFVADEKTSSLSLEKMVTEESEENKDPLQKAYQMDIVNMLIDPDLNNFTTTSTVNNPPDGSECTNLDEEEMYSKKQEMGAILEKSKTSILEEVVQLEDNTSYQKGCKMNFMSCSDDPDFDAFSKRSSIVNSVKKDFTVMKDMGTHESEMGEILVKRETSLLSDKVVVTEDAEKDKCSSQKGYQMDSQNILDDPFTTKSDNINSPEEKQFSVVNEKEMQIQKSKTVVTPEKEEEIQLKSEKKETSPPKQIVKELVKDDSTPKECYQMDFPSKLNDANFDPFKTKAVLQNSHVREENACRMQMETKRGINLDDFMSKVMLEEKSVKKSKNISKSDGGNIPVSQEIDVRDSAFDTLSTESGIVNSPSKKVFSVADKERTQSQKAKTGTTAKKKQKKCVMCKKDTPSSQKKLIETAAKDGLPPRKCCQMDFLSKLDGPNFDPFATKSSVVNSPEKQDLSDVNDEGTQSYKLKMGIIPEKKQDTQMTCKEKETQVSLQKVVVETAVKDSAPQQKCYHMSNLDDPTFDPFKTKAAVQNSPVRKENAFNIHMETEEKTSHEESGLKRVTEEKYIKRLEKIVTKSEQNKSPVLQEDSTTDCLKKVDQIVILKSEEIKKGVSVVTPSTSQVVEKKQASSLGSDQCDIFSPLPKGRARTQGCPIFDEEFTSATDFFNSPEDLDMLGTHGTEGDKLNLVRNSLYVKFDPLVSGRQSLAPYLAQQVKESEMDSRRCSGLISFSPSPIKHRRDSDITGTPVRALLSTQADETVVLDTTDLDNTTVRVGGNTTFMSCNQTFNNTVICSSTPDSANETIIHQPVVNGEKMVTEHEMNEKLKNMELIMQGNEMRKCREYDGVLKTLKQQIMEDGIALNALEEENSALKSSIQQMQDTLTKILQQDKVEKEEHRNQLQLLENQYELKCAALQKECHQYQDELKKSEVPFFDLVKKYERLREVLECLRRNEESLKSDSEKLKTKMAQREKNFGTIIQTYEDKLEMTEDEICDLKQNCEQELKKASVMLKKAELKILSLTEMVEKLNTERERLTDLLEDITNNMGTTAM